MKQLGGTSFAAPQVAVLGAILLSNNNMPPAKIRKIIKGTSHNEQDVNWNEHSGYGLINFAEALAQLNGSENHESNNTKEKSSILRIGKMEDGTITPGDEYWYHVRLAHTGTILFSYGQTNLNLEQALFDSTGKLVPIYENRAKVLEGDYYYRIIMPESQTLSMNQVYYSLVATFEMDKDLYEGSIRNDSIENSYLIEDIDKTYFGNFDRTNDHDFYKITLMYDCTVRIHISVDTARIDPACLFYFRGMEVEIDNGSAGEPEDIQLQTHAGDTIVLDLYNKLSLSSVASGEYKIEITVSKEPHT